jgi:hypothetical protein
MPCRVVRRPSNESYHLCDWRVCICSYLSSFSSSPAAAPSKIPRRQRRADRGAGDRPMAEPALDSPGVVPFVGEGVAAGVPQHVRVGLSSRPCSNGLSKSRNSRLAGANPAGSQRKWPMITLGRTGTLVPRVFGLIVGWGVRSTPVRPKIAMRSDYGSPTKKRWRSRYRRSTRSSIGLRILLVAVASVAGVVGVSGVYPQIIDSEWARGMNPHSQGIARSETAPETVGLTQQTRPPARRGLNGSPNSSVTIRKRRRCPVFARCKTSFDLCLAATSPLFFER